MHVKERGKDTLFIHLYRDRYKDTLYLHLYRERFENTYIYKGADTLIHVYIYAETDTKIHIYTQTGADPRKRDTCIHTYDIILFCIVPLSLVMYTCLQKQVHGQIGR